MPWHIGKSTSCPSTKPYAVIKDSDGAVEGCHPTRAAAKKQLAALYAQEQNQDPHLAEARRDEQGDSPMTEVERRYTLAETGRAELRAEGELRKIGGYASVFNKQSRNLGGFVEVVTPAAFAKSRGDGWPDVVARYNHDDNMLLGTTGARTLTLSIDSFGLSYLITPPQSRTDILELVERGDVSKSSFAFRTVEDDWSLTDQGFPLRSLLAVQLVDIAPVVTPAYPDTTSGLRSLAEHVHAPLEEVRKLAEDNDLRRFFVRTDKTTGKKRPEKATTYGPAARMAILGKESDPWS